MNINTKTGIRFGVADARNYMGLYEAILQSGEFIEGDEYIVEPMKRYLQKQYNSLYEIEHLPNDSNKIHHYKKTINCIIDFLKKYIDFDYIKFYDDLEDDILKINFQEIQDFDSLVKAFKPFTTEEYLNNVLSAAKNQYFSEILERGETPTMRYVEKTGNNEEFVCQLSNLGGMPLIFVMSSPVLVKKPLCSPCIPNAIDLDADDSSKEIYVGYGIPDFWRDEIDNS